MAQKQDSGSRQSKVPAETEVGSVKYHQLHYLSEKLNALKAIFPYYGTHPILRRIADKEDGTRLVTLDPDFLTGEGKSVMVLNVDLLNLFFDKDFKGCINSLIEYYGFLLENVERTKKGGGELYEFGSELRLHLELIKSGKGRKRISAHGLTKALFPFPL